MNLTLRPGFVYILHSPYRPKDVKLGKAYSVEEREHGLALGDPDLKLHACLPFLDAVAAETAMHDAFEDKRLSRETFRVSRAAALRELKRISGNEAGPLAELKKHIRTLYDIGLLSADDSDSVAPCSGSALSVLLAHTPSERDGRNVKELVRLALSRTTAADDAAKLLKKCGLLAYSTDSLVLFDRTSSALAAVFRRKPCRDTWKQQLARYAGLDENGRAQSLNGWLEETHASSALVDCVNPIV